MKVAFDISDLSTARRDGTTRYTNELAQRLPALNGAVDWTYLAPHSSVQTTQVCQSQPHVTCTYSPWPKYWTQVRLPWVLQRIKPDVLFMPIQQLPYLRPRGTRTVAVIHDLAVHRYPEQFTYKDWLLLHTFSAYAVREADALIAVSAATAADIQRYYGRTHNVYVVPHGVDHAHFRPVRAQEERGGSWTKLLAAYPALRTPYLLYVGQIQPRKNLERLIAAFEQLTDLPNLQLVIAGGHGWLQQPIIKRIAASPRAADIYQIGLVPEDLLTPLYWHAQAMVMPSLYEGFGMPVLEAMASGCPVVTSNVSSLPEIGGGAAIYVDPKLVPEIARGIREALVNREKLQALGYAQAAQFSWEKAAQQTLAVLQRVHSAHG